MYWTEVTICTTTEGSDAMAQVLFSVGVGGVSIDDPADIGMVQQHSGDWDYIDESLLLDRGDPVYVRGYIASHHEQKVAAIRRKVALFLALQDTIGLDFGSGEVTIRTIADEDWSQNWKKYYKPIAIGETLAIAPSWEPCDMPGRAVVKLDPGIAFGTGQHETTQMCLEMAEKIVQPGHRVLDVGCGTGILGIASVALGAKQAIMIDNYDAAVDAAIYNATLNDVAASVDIREGNLATDVEGEFNVVFANIVAETVILMLSDAKRLLAKRGALIASGIISNREQDVVDAAEQHGYYVDGRMERGEWIALLLRIQR